jgi:hypothetical protein
MPAPSPSFIVADPPPLNPASFPYRVDEFPAAALSDELARLIPLETREPAPAAPRNPHRYQG